MATRGRVAIILGVVLGLAALGFVYRRSLGDKQLRNAQAEVERWEVRWYAARECLLGKVPPSAKIREALAIHEMVPGPWEPAKCNKLVGTLTRGDAPDSGIDELEAAWRKLDKVATAAAQAYVLHISPATKVADDPFPLALEALDEAHAGLRTVAKLPPLAETGASLRAAQVIPILLDGHHVTHLEVESIPSARGLVLFGDMAQQQVQVILTTGGMPKAAALSVDGDLLERVGTLRSVPDASWGALADGNRVRAGLFDPSGLLRSDFDGKGVFETHGPPVVVAALGTPTLGTLALVDDDRLVLAHLVGDAIEKPAPIPLARSSEGPAFTAAADVDGRAALVWRAPNHDVLARIIRPGDDGATSELDELPDGPFCLTAGAAWARVESGAMTFGGERFAVDSDSHIDALLGCTETAALFRDSSDARRVFVCASANEGCTSTEIPAGPPQGPALALVGKDIVALASHGGVLGVWRSGAQPVYYSLPEPAMPASVFDMTAMAMTDGDLIDVLARTAMGYVIVRVPVR
jgi:hypothetical protein